MNNAIVIFLMGLFVALINELSLSLGLTTRLIDAPQTVTDIEDAGFLEGLLSAIRWGINNVGSFMQLVTFSADLPYIINAILLAPFGLMAFYIAFVMIRGGAS